MMDDTPAIEFESVTRTFDGVTALEDLDLTVRRGELYGFLGPNGAGKTTTIRLLLNFLRPTDGAIRVFGRDVRTEELTIKARTGTLPEGFTPYPELTGREHLALVRSVRGIDAELDRYLDRVGLIDAADRPAGGYSQGMIRRLGLAMALVGEPDLLILDEPIAGLDPNGAAQLREIVRKENQNGTTVFFSSHQLAQVEMLCDRVAIISDGRLVTQRSIEELLDYAEAGVTLTVTPESPLSSVPPPVTALEGVETTAIEDGALIVDCVELAVRSDVLTALVEAGIVVDGFDTERASLEEFFVESVGASESNGP